MKPLSEQSQQIITAVRIEHKIHKIGIYYRSDRYRDIKELQLTYNLYKEVICAIRNFPTPWLDNFHNGVNVIRYDEFCAFRSLRQIKKYFPKHVLISLQELGYEVQLLTLKEAKISRRQILFEKCNIIEKKIIIIK